MKKLFLFMALTFLLIGFASAEVEYWQTSELKGNGITQNHLVASYTKAGIISNDYVSGNNPLEVYIWYNIYPKKFNKDNIGINNTNYLVNYCNFTITFYSHISNQSSIIFNKTYNDNTDDDLNAKQFVQLQNGDSMISDLLCQFQNTNLSSFDVPLSQQLVTPTWECKSCQFYEWTLQERNLVKAQNISSNSVQTFGFIKKLFVLNFEVWLMLFWVALILIVFTSLSFIFLGLFWFYKYLMGVVK